MKKFRRILMWLALVLIIMLTILSVYGAFIGAERAQGFFNSAPSVVYWVVLGVALIAGLVAFRRLIRVPGLLLTHAGCILILIGGMLGSEKGYRVSGNDTTRKGLMQIDEGQSTNRVFVRKKEGQGHDMKELPFFVKLNDFRIEYYEPGYLEIETGDGKVQRVVAEVGRRIDLGAEQGKAQIVKTFENWKMSMEDGKRTAYEDPHPGSNPALAVQITPPSGEATTHHVFSLHPGFGHDPNAPKMLYNRPVNRAISDYISELEVIDKDGKIVAKKDIEVNHPLRYGGYRFYQQDYDHQAGRYTILEAVSDTGIPVVFAGYWMLCVGVIWHMWLSHLFKNIRSKKQTDGN
ncbi:MAG: cytochrome c biogenesis protein ResB [Phycisphaerae bacterium]|jgi:hypothetical protein|nr:cytochrome c biogenesis protein ResB [Phycisphaerae bacterium]